MRNTDIKKWERRSLGGRLFCCGFHRLRSEAFETKTIHKAEDHDLEKANKKYQFYIGIFKV